MTWGSDHPFRELISVICRNVLIYFTPELQTRALEMFAFALRDGGLLVLGKAETASLAPDYFTPVQTALRIYRRQGAPLPLLRSGEWTTMARHQRDNTGARHSIAQDLMRLRRENAQTQEAQLAAETVLLNLPVGVVMVDRRYDIQRINSRARRLLGIHTEALGADLIHLVRNVPSQQIRAAIDATFAGQATTLDAVPIEVVAPGEARYVRISCQIESTEQVSDGPVVVLVIADVTQVEEARLAMQAQAAAADLKLARLQETVDQLSVRNRELLAANEELTTTNVMLRNTADEYVLSNEEIQAATEEVETLNEELQSTNEELETLNEEQQATVEELEATNDELRTRNQQTQELADALDAQQQHLQVILDSMAEGVLVLDRTGTIMFANSSFIQMMEPADGAFVAEGAEGQPLSPEATPQHRVQQGETFLMEFTMMAADGQRHWYEATGRPLSDGAVHRDAVLVIRDMTDRTLRRLQDAFLTLASHELRTPLTSIEGYLSLLVRDPHIQGDTEHILHRTQGALDETRRLQRLIDDLLDVDHLQSGTFTLTRAPVDLTAVVTRAVEIMPAQANEHPVRLDAPTEALLVDADALRLEQVMLNLLTNARTYAPDSAIDVRVRRQEDEAEVEVQDHGPGIAATELPQMFTRFYQAAALPRSPQGGMGLGLFIAREIVEAHGGTIDVRSTEGDGVICRVRLPVWDAGPMD